MTKFDRLVNSLLTEGRLLNRVDKIESYPTGSKVTFLPNELHPDKGNIIYYKNEPNDDFTDLTPLPKKEYGTSLRRHRLDGAAVTRPSGRMEYWIDGEEYSYEDFYKHPEVTLYHTMQKVPSKHRKTATSILDI